MRITLRLDGETSDDGAVALTNWLNRDRDVTRVAKASARADRPKGSMGALDVIDVILTHATAISAVLLAYVSWRGTRRIPPGLTITSRTVNMTVTEVSPETITKVVELLAAESSAEAAASSRPVGSGQ